MCLCARVCVLVCLASVKYAVCIDLLFGPEMKLSNVVVPRARLLAQIIPVQFGNVLVMVFQVARMLFWRKV